MSNRAPAESAPKSGRISQIIQTYKLTKQSDPRLGLILVAIIIPFPIVITVIAWLVNGRAWSWTLIPWIVAGLLAGLIAATFVFGRRAERSAYAQIEGQPGAAAAVIGSLRSGWFSTPAVAMTKNQDIVHRVVGRPGIILVSEGPPQRVAVLLANERRRTSRFAPDIPIHEVQSGDEAGQVSLRKLNARIMKLPRVLRPEEVTALRKRLEAVSSSPVPIPKGPMPKGSKMPKGARG